MAVLRVCHGATNAINQESLAPVINLFIYAFISGCAESLLLRTGYSLVAMPMLLIVGTSLNAKQGL